VLIHCAQGVRRTGMFVAAYQESVLGYDKSKAKAAVVSFGHGRNTIEQIDRFIDGYDPKSQTVPADLGAGSE
jgi:protein tyrosine/serine phosphatase